MLVITRISLPLAPITSETRSHFLKISHDLFAKSREMLKDFNPGRGMGSYELLIA